MKLLNKLKFRKQNKIDTTAEKDISLEISGEVSSFKERSIKELVRPDGVNALPLDHLVIDDEGQAVYVRCFYIKELPTNATFAKTFRGIFDFKNSVCNVLVDPKSKGEGVSEVNKELVAIESEYISAKKNFETAKIREKKVKFAEGEALARRLDAEVDVIFDVRFIFAIYADSLDELDIRTTEFVNKGRESSIVLNAFFARHLQAYKILFPDNRMKMSESRMGTGSKNRFEESIMNSFLYSVPAHRFNKDSISTIFHQTTAEFNHENGVPLGRNRITGNLVNYDFYDPGHFGYGVIIVGKTNSGKGTLIKKLVNLNHTINGMRFVCADTEDKNGEGEYCPIARAMGGDIFKLNAQSNTVLGLYDVEPERVYRNDGSYYDTLDLANKLALIEQINIIMLQGDKLGDTTVGKVTAQHLSIIKEINTELYNEKEIYDGEVDSLYNFNEQTYDDQLGFVHGKVKKDMPTITEAFIKALKKKKYNTDSEMSQAYSDYVSMMPTYVKELYICMECFHRYSKDEFRALEKRDGVPLCNCGECHGTVNMYKGSRSYFDGQTNVKISADSPFTNIDMSRQHESDKYVSLLVSMMIILEYFVKKNANVAEHAEAMGTIWDELKKLKKHAEAIEFIDLLYRICRKRYVAPISATQRLPDYDGELESIVTQSTSVFVFNHNPADKDYIARMLGITKSEANQCIRSAIGDCLLVDDTGIALLKVEALDIEKRLIFSDANRTYTETDKLA